MKSRLLFTAAFLLLPYGAMADNLIPQDLMRASPIEAQPVQPVEPVPFTPPAQPLNNTPFQAAVITPHDSGIPTLSGGIGADEVAAIQTAKGDYNLHIMSANAIGQFTGEIRIIIKDKAKNTVLDTEGGPLFYAKLPSGTYYVEGVREGISKKQTITIAGNKSAHIHFGW